MDSARHIIIHGHFYQPPRESPWTGIVANEASAAPFPNWNERILSECYNANAHAQIMEGSVVYIRNNFEALSFNFGPTLSSWLQTHGKLAARAIRRGDELSRERQGYGNAIAQAYNHSILPLLDARDRALQIAWGIGDFVARYGRRPDGIWLPECAVDSDTMVSLAQAGMKFILLGANQGKFSSNGREAGPFLWRRDELQLAVFRFDRAISGSIAFGDTLRDGVGFAEMLMTNALALAPGQSLLVATDGETFGHHKRAGAAELARAIKILEQRDDIILTNCAQYLATHPAAGAFELDSASAWSCAHGVERWRSNCGCRNDPNSTQEWRAPLRAAMDFVRYHCNAVYDQFSMGLIDEPQAALEQAARLFADSAPGVQEEFFQRYRAKDEAAGERMMRLFEMVRAAQAALTSCAWFFDDFGGLESRIVLRWAARAVELAAEFVPSIEGELLRRLREISSHRREVGDGATLYLSLKTREARGRV